MVTETKSSGIGDAHASKTSPDANLQDLPDSQNPAKLSKTVVNVPTKEEVNASLYSNELVEEVERLTKESQAPVTATPLVVSDEMAAARIEAQRALVLELKGTLAARRASARNVPDPVHAVTVRLVKRHTHNGQEYEQGAEIKVDEVIAKWLETNKVGDRV